KMRVRVAGRRSRGRMRAPMLEKTADGSRPTSERAAQPGLVVVYSAGQILCLTLAVANKPVVLGRGPGSAGLTVPDTRLSRGHAVIPRSRGGWTTRAAASRNGTFVDGDVVHGAIAVARPRTIRLADTLLIAVDDIDAVVAPEPRPRESRAHEAGEVIGSR